MKDVTQTIVFFVSTCATSLYKAFVALELWNWFVASALHLSDISFWMMYGLVLFVELFRTYNYIANKIDEQRWKRLMLALDAIVPEDGAKRIQDEMQYEESAPLMAFWGIVSSVLESSAALGIGWFVHTALV